MFYFFEQQTSFEKSPYSKLAERTVFPTAESGVGCGGIIKIVFFPVHHSGMIYLITLRTSVSCENVFVHAVNSQRLHNAGLSAVCTVHIQMSPVVVNPPVIIIRLICPRVGGIGIGAENSDQPSGRPASGKFSSGRRNYCRQAARYWFRCSNCDYAISRR